MSEMTTLPLSPQQSAEYESAMNEIFAEIHLLNQQMQQDRAEIERSKARSASLEMETQSILTRLKAMVWRIWNKVVEYGKLLVSVVQKQKKQEEDIKELRQDFARLHEEVRDLARIVERLAYEIQRDRDKSEAERRIVLLEIENRFLRFERSLPPGTRADENNAS